MPLEEPGPLIQGVNRSLQALALPVEEQVRQFTGTCKPCALMTDFFYYWWSLDRYYPHLLTAGQKASVDCVAALIDEISRSASYECWEVKPIKMRLAWEGLRWRAGEALAGLGGETELGGGTA